MKAQSFLSSTIVILMSAALPVSAEILYYVIDLGTLDGYELSRVWSINNNGQIAGFAMDANIPNNTRAVLFDPTGDGNNIDLGTLGGENSSATSINDNGQIVGAADTGGQPLDYCATIFDPNGSGNNTPLSLSESVAWESNDNGQAVGWVLLTPDGGTDSFERATLFDPNREPNMINLGTLPQYSDSEALSINNNNLIVGYVYNHSGNPFADMRAVLFDYSGGGDNIDLGTLPGYESAIALSVNNSGQIVGRANNSDMSIENYNPRAVLFDPNEVNNIDLGTLPGCDSAEAFSINNKGQIVGRAIFESWTDYAVLFDSTDDGNNINLNDLIDPALGWDLHLAISINDSGWIVGWGYNHHYPIGYQNSFLLIPFIRGDLEPDGDVDFADFAVLASAWRSSYGDDNWNPFCDISEPNDGVIDERDLAVFANNWLMNVP